LHGPRVLLGSREDRARHPPVGSQHAARLSKRSGRIRHQHVAPAAEDTVDGIIRQVETLAIENTTFDVVEAELFGSATRNLDIALAKSLTITRPGVVTGPTWEAVVDAADALHAAVIVTGSRGLASGRELLEGSLSQDPTLAAPS
jgi:nucleotide-binding universal stress UspA family protein